MKRWIFAALAIVTLTAESCNGTPDSVLKERRAQEQMSKQAIQAVGMPAIVNFQEKRVLKNILELRDTEIKTVTYIVDWQAGLHKVCDSIGYGVSAATQYTNPMRQANDYHDAPALPQADPNGLFSPSSAEGTWVMCLNPETKKLSPIYVEPRVIVSPFALAGAK